jgi:peptidoglycan/xylan/chitin deacetylase (PgdA/CDA1 family)
MIIAGVTFFWILPILALLYILYIVKQEYRADRIPILLYHRLLSRGDAESGRVLDDEMIYVTYETSFFEQMEVLKEAGYTFLDFDDYVAIRDGAQRLPRKPVIITFDDGYKSNFVYGYPILKKHGIKATIFAVPEPNDYSLKCIEGCDSFMSDEEMKELSENNVSIQSHTMTHCVLNELNKEEANAELVGSKERLSEITRRPVRHIAIPRAGYSRFVKKLVKQADYQTACCNNKGSANLKTDPLALPRVVIERDMTIDAFLKALSPGTSIQLRIIGNIKRIPERLGGAKFAKRIRNILYAGFWKPLFKTHNLKRIIGVCSFFYVVTCIWFTYWMATRR